MVGFNRRFDPTFTEIRDRIAAGEIGKLEQLIITSRDPAPAPAAYIASSGGLFRDMTIHDFDMARFFLGEVVEVQATGANLIEPYIAEAGDIDSAVVVLRGTGGELCQIVNSRRCSFGYDQRLEAFGAEGMLTAGNQVATSVRRSGAAGTETAPPYLNFFLDRYTPAYRAELDHLVTCVEQGQRAEPRLRRRPGGAGARGRGEREHEDRAGGAGRSLSRRDGSRKRGCRGSTSGW